MIEIYTGINRKRKYDTNNNYIIIENKKGFLNIFIFLLIFMNGNLVFRSLIFKAESI